MVQLNTEIRYDEIAVVLTGKDGATFRKDWKATADRNDAIRWTLPYTRDYDMIIAKIEIIEGSGIEPN